jgi:hypothetical protein
VLRNYYFRVDQTKHVLFLILISNIYNIIVNYDFRVGQTKHVCKYCSCFSFTRGFFFLSNSIHMESFDLLTIFAKANNFEQFAFDQSNTSNRTICIQTIEQSAIEQFAFEQTAFGQTVSCEPSQANQRKSKQGPTPKRFLSLIRTQITTMSDFSKKTVHIPCQSLAFKKNVF